MMLSKKAGEDKIKKEVKKDDSKCEQLEYLINEYSHKDGYREAIAEEIKEFKEVVIDIAEAITNAATTMVDGKRHPHHYRKSKNTLECAKKILLGKQSNISATKNFDNLHEIIIKSLEGLKYIGPLYYYDTAFLIGAHLDKLPEKIYLHAGTKKGAKNMEINIRNKKYIEMEDILCHKIFKKYCLKPYEIEDFLCIYKEELSTIFKK
ncbi:MAG: hypothetical protein ACYCS0_08335 [bacterium]|jgi:hypothetical protein